MSLIQTWQESIICRLAAFVNFTSSQMSLVIITLMSYSRVKCILFNRAVNVTKHVKAVSLGIWVCVAVFTIMVCFSSLILSSDWIRIKNNVCLLFGATGHHRVNYKEIILYTVYIIINSLCLVAIIICYTLILYVIWQSSKTMAASKSSGNSGDIVIRTSRKSLVLVTITLLTWLPILVILALGLAGQTIHENVFVWVAAFLVPINASLNPIIYSARSR